MAGNSSELETFHSECVSKNDIQKLKKTSQKNDENQVLLTTYYGG